ncbi:MAG: response regulator transcription factor [Proteobacteria bacterium]|nr:response regulator transcription factor [Pseudomonadota bacterium]
MTSALATILVVEDDPSLALGLQLNLEAEGYRVLLARDGADGLRQALASAPDLIVLDRMLPRMEGLDLLAEVRERGHEMPVIIVSARGEVHDKLDGLGLGADDYMTKPFSVAELAARIQVALRRSRRSGRAAAVLRCGEVELDLDGHQVRRAGQEVLLTAKEFDLLAYLARHPRRVHSRDQLLVAVWGDDYEGTARTVDNFVRSLRVKLERDPAHPDYLVTVRGAGYRFDLPV